MGLLIAGIIEAVIGMGLGLYLLIGQPSLNAIWGWGLIGLGIVTGVISVFLRKNAVAPAAEQADSDPKSKSSQNDLPSSSLYSLPERASEPLGIQTVSTILGERIDYLQLQIARMRWRYRATEIHARAGNIAEVVMKNHADNESQTYDERPRQLRRLLELFILSQGYEAWANGLEPAFHVDRYRAMLSKEDILERETDLSREADVLWQEIDKSRVMAQVPDDDLYRQGVDVRIRLERLTQSQERLEEIEILQKGYASLFDHGEYNHQKSETTEEGR